MHTVSLLKFYSIGRLAANKPLDTNIIEVVPIEASSNLDGEINAGLDKFSAKGTDQTGAAYSLELDMSTAVTAEWSPFGRGNRVTSPDLRRGDQVVLWKFADKEKYYWTEMDDLVHRKLETVVWAISATTKESDGSTGDTTYYVEMSSHRKLIHLHTSSANGEFCEYDIQINADEGFLQFQDNVGQSIMMNSKERQIELLNNDGAKIDMNKRKLFIHIPDLVEIKTKKVTIDAIDMISTLSNSMTLTTKANKTTTDTDVLQAKTVTISADTRSITATTTHTGEYSIKGTLGVSGLTTMSGGMKWSGGGKGGGTIEVDKLISSQPIKAPNVSGG